MEALLAISIVNPLIHIRYAINSAKHVYNMKTKMELLGERSTELGRQVDHHMMNALAIPHGVFGWLNEVESVQAEFESILCEGSGCLNIKMRYRTGRKAFGMTETIENLLESSLEFNWTNAPIPLAKVYSTSTPSTSSTPLLSSRERQFNDALKFLQQDDNDSQVIALCGPGGVGKTTMMEQLKNVADDKIMFDWIVKVCIGRKPNILSIQNDVAGCIGRECLREETVTARADRLSKLFKTIVEEEEGNILVILDDVWEEFELKSIGLASPMPNGVKLLLTSRDSYICTKFADQAGSTLKLVDIGVLEEAEAYTLLSHFTGVSKEDDHEMYQIGCDIVKKCGGLPIAIKIICTTLKHQEKSVWKTVLCHLNNENDIDKHVEEIIKMSYDCIRQEEDKEIFLLCSLFPEDFDIPIEDLARHAWGLNLLKHVSTVGEARSMTKICVQNLINANLLMRSRDHGCVKMHNLTLAFVLGIVSTGNHQWIINHGHRFMLGLDEMREHSKIISLTCTGMSEFPRDLKYPNLSLIQLMDGDLSLKFQEDFYDHMKNLQVIAYYNMRYPLLPRSLQNLKTLCLYKCTLMSDYSFLGDLVNLEVLSLAGCGIRKLTFNLRKLTKLKLLDLTGCVDLHIDDGVFLNLTCLEELYIRVSDGKAIRFTNANFEELKMLSRQLFALEVEFFEKKTWLRNMSFKKLEKFKISMGCLLDKEKDIDKYFFNNTLKIVTDSSSDLLHCRIAELFNRTEKLHLQVEDMTQLQDVSHAPYQIYSFFNLRDLEVCNCLELEYLFPISVASGLRKLERLKVSSCFVMVALVDGDGREIEFKELRFLSLEQLPELVHLFPNESVVKLPQLAELEVDGLPNFTSIYPDKKKNSSLFKCQVSILKLEKLRIKRMKNLKQIWADSREEEVEDNSMLKEIKVDECDTLVNLFPNNPMRLLRHLEELRVRNCGSLEVIFNVDLEYYIGDEVSNSSLRVIQVHGLKNLREVWRIKGVERYSYSFISFAGVESISIRKCKMFRNVFTPTEAKFNMRAFANISIYDCGERGRNKEVEINVMPSVDEPKVVEDKYDVAPQSSIRVPSLSNDISNLNLGNSPLKVVFKITTQEQDTQQQTPLYPNLKNLRLSHMERMTHVWKGDNSVNLLNQSSFNNLTTIYLYQCKKIKYLFSPLMAQLLRNLKEIHLDACDSMKQVVSNGDDKEEEIITSASTSTSTSTTTFFPNLHSLIIHFLRSLKGIGGGGDQDEFKFSQVSVVCSSLFHYSREIHISWCDGLSEIFEIQDSNNNSGSNSSFDNDEGNCGIHNISLAFSKIQNINVPQLYNLKKLVITNCGLLQHVFSFSTLESLKQLQKLQIQECEAMKVIVKEESGEQRNVVVFPNLRSLELSNLQNLKGFFLGTNNFTWPSLETVMISKCPQIVMFTKGKSITPKLEYMHTSLGKHSLECGWNFDLTTDLHKTMLPNSRRRSLEILPWTFENLIELHMPSNYDPDINCIIPFKELGKLQMLEKIQLDWCFHVHEVFEEETMELEGTKSVEIPNLRDVELSNLEDLKHIWKGAKPVLLFPKLTTLSIDHCENLEHVFTSSMVASLQQLQYLHISTCSNMKVVIVAENDAEVKDIVALPSLKSLGLEELQSLEDFWKGKDNFSWPLLHTSIIKDCPQLRNFSYSTKRN